MIERVRGLDFALTALFIVLAIEGFRSDRDKTTALLATGTTDLIVDGEEAEVLHRLVVDRIELRLQEAQDLVEVQPHLAVVLEELFHPVARAEVGPLDGPVLDPEAGVVRFGDGLRGARPPLGARLVARYEVCEGARGNVAAAVVAASASNLFGIFITPLLVGLLMHTQGGAAGGWQSVRDIVVQLLLPFIVGQLARPLVSVMMLTAKVSTSSTISLAARPSA